MAIDTLLWLMLTPIGVIVWGFACTVALVVAMIFIEALDVILSK